MQNIKHISTAVQQAVDYLDRRRKGEEKSLKVSHNKLNTSLLDGIPWNRILSLCGRSGSGKSTILEQWKRDLIQLNPDEKIEVLSFEYEMLAMDQVIRNVAGMIGSTTDDLQSVNNPLDDITYNKVISTSKEITDYPIFYVDSSGTVNEMASTIDNFVEVRNVKEEKKSLIFTIDHIILTKGKDGETEKKIIDDLYKMLIDKKRKLVDDGVNCLFICISQLNRDIESVERRKPAYHYPNQNDIFAASSVYHGSDYVLISHNPSNIQGLDSYGMLKLPLRTPEGNALLYWHLIKNRFGKNRVMVMVEDFIHSRVLDYKGVLLQNIPED